MPGKKKKAQGPAGRAKSSARARPRPKGRRRTPGGAEPTTDAEVAAAVRRACSLLMERGVRACVRDNIPAGIILMASTEQMGLVASMMGLPYPQALQAACNGVEAIYRVAAPEQVRADRPIEDMAQAMVQRALRQKKEAKNGCEPGEDGNMGLTP